MLLSKLTLHNAFGILALLTIPFVTGCGSNTPTLPPESNQAVVQEKPDFSGHWELDYSMSDDLNDKLERTAYDLNRNRGNGSASGRALYDMARFTDSITRTSIIDIEQDQWGIEIQRNDNFPLSCAFQPGQQTSYNSVFGSEVCGWSGEQLVFIADLPEGLDIRHRLTLSPDKDRLNLATTVYTRSSSAPFTMNRVYMRFEPPEQEYDCEQTLSKNTVCKRSRLMQPSDETSASKTGSFSERSPFTPVK